LALMARAESSKSARPAAESEGVAADADRRLDFSIEVDGGRGCLALRPHRFFGWLIVDELQLEIPNVCFPLDITRGIKQFQQQRCRVMSAAFALDEQAIEGLAHQQAGPLAAAGFEEVALRLIDRAIIITARVRQAGWTVDLVTTVGIARVGGAIAITVEAARAFGHARRPAQLLAHDLLCVLLAAAPDDIGAAGAPVVRGLGRFALSPVDLFLWRTFPAGGWRLPDAGLVQCTALDVQRTRIDARCNWSEDAVRPAAGSPPEGRVDSPAQAALLDGDLDGAVAAYRAEIARRPQDARALTERLLEILCARPATFGDAEPIARDALARWPDFLPALLAQASVAVGRDRAADAAAHFATAYDLAAAAGDDEDAVRAALAAARHLRAVEPTRATVFYERVLQRRPDQLEAANALGERYQQEERWADLLRLARRRIAGLSDAREKAREHHRIADIYRLHLDEPERARTELRAAVELDADRLQAWETLAEIHEKLADRAAAVVALERVATLQAAKRDAVGQARSQARIAALLEAGGENERAYAGYQAALALLPEEPALVERLAAMAARTGRREEALTRYDRLLEICPPPDPRGRAAQHALARLLADGGELERARRILRRTGGDPDLETALVLVELERKAGDTSATLDALALAASLAEGERRAELQLERGRLAAAARRETIATEAWEVAHAAAPGGPAGAGAARQLAEHAREKGDAPGEAHWIDAALAVPASPDGATDGDAEGERAALVLRRARLHDAAGEWPAARALLEPLVARPNASMEARLLCSDVIGRLGDTAGQARLLQSAALAATDAERATVLIALVRAHLRAGDAKAALKAAEQAYGLDPNDGGTKRAYGDAALAAGAWDDVVWIYREILESASMSEHAECARRLGLGLERQGNPREAMTAFKQAIEAAGGRGEPLAAAWRNLAELHERLGEYARAADAYARAAVDPRTDEPLGPRAQKHVRAAILLGRRLGESARAIAELEAAVEKDPDYLAALDALESMHAEAGDHERVASVLKRKLDVSGAPADKRRAWLARLADLEDRVLGRADAARAAHERILELEPEARGSLEYLARDAVHRRDQAAAEAYQERLTALGSEGAARDPVQRTEVLAGLARRALEEGRDDEAERHLRAAVQIAAAERREQLYRELEALLERARRWMDLAQVLAEHAAATADAKVRVDLEQRYVHLLLDAGDAAQALKACVVALGRAPGDRRLLTLLIDAARAAGDVGARAEGLARLAAVDTDRRSELLAEAIDLHLGQDDVDKAQRLFDHLLEEPPPPEELLTLARRVRDPSMAGGLAAAAAERLSSDAHRAAAFRLAADKAAEIGDREAEIEQLQALARLGAAELGELTRLAAQLDVDRRTAEAAVALAQALKTHLRTRSRSEPAEAVGRQLLEDLRAAATLSGQPHLLADGLCAIAEHEADPVAAAALLREAGLIRRDVVGDAVGAADAFSAALTQCPEDEAVLEPLEALLRALGDLTRLCEVYSLHLETTSGEVRARKLRVLASLYRESGDAARAALMEGEAVTEVSAPIDETGSIHRVAAAPPPRLPADLETVVQGMIERGDLPAAIHEVGRRLEALPPSEVGRITVLRHELAELLLLGGDRAAARRLLEQVVSEAPRTAGALARLADLYAAEGRHEAAASIVASLASLSAAPERRAELLYRLGEIYAVRLGDWDRASDAYLKGIDADPGHVPILRRLIDHYFTMGDLAETAAVAQELMDVDGLLDAATPRRALARAALAAALTDQEALGLTIVGALGNADAEAMAVALAEAVARKPADEAIVADAARRLCVGLGLRLAPVRAVLEERGHRDPVSTALATRLAPT
jgi:Tfp pilus assembly protein PilF